ncbi:facilitated trehalose transporter Tret1-like isoform X1 [Hylaeus anthracinus]|uniref:facilitated trehalose transporter Tret1-like isoform X1 n=2 Tax=Hylaeus anthracinus TaxID=313031 RepID=UPI0023B9423B|nr:facilitated trehalose transporter Tret1-like isoform X1 [Hylaeus anthracinus]
MALVAEPQRPSLDLLGNIYRYYLVFNVLWILRSSWIVYVLRKPFIETMKTIYLAIIAGNLGMMSYGLFFGWSSPSLPLLLQEDSPVPLTRQESAWVAAIQTLGGSVGPLLFVHIVNVIGRKWSLLLTGVPGIVGWLMIAFATSAWELYIARFFHGLSSSCGYVVCMMYTGEISPASIRGVLTAALTVFGKIGVSFEWTIGPFLTVMELAMTSLSLSILFVVCTLWIPESPYHLMRRGRHQEAIHTLAQLRGTTNVSEEATAIEKSVELDLANDTGLRELLCVSGNRKAIIVVVTLVVVQQWSGSMAIMSYAQQILDTTKENNGKYITMILGAVQVVSTIIGMCLVDRFGRRLLLIVSAFGTFVSTTLVGLFFYLQDRQFDVDNILLLPSIGTILYIVSYTLGLAAVPFTMISEVFPTNVKALGSTIAMFFCNFTSFCVTASYPRIADQFGLYTSFWIFSAISLAGVFFTYFYVPETKGKTLQEVQNQLHGRKLV